MSRGASPMSWRTVRAQVLERIQAREWAPGERIPHEADLAAEFGCARATVNRALREIAGTGLIERRRRAGTRVALHPSRRATLDIPIVRVEVESRGETYGYALIRREMAAPPHSVRARLKTPPDARMLHVACVHSGDGRPHALEDRWIDPAAVAGAAEADFSRISPNEWLVLNVPFEGGDIAFSAANATASEAETLACSAGAPLFVTERTTWQDTRVLTTVRLLFAPGYRLRTLI